MKPETRKKLLDILWNADDITESEFDEVDAVIRKIFLHPQTQTTTQGDSDRS